MSYVNTWSLAVVRLRFLREGASLVYWIAFKRSVISYVSFKTSGVRVSPFPASPPPRSEGDERTAGTVI